MVANKLGLVFSLICVLSLASNSMGFDVYAHGVLFYFHEYILNHTDLLFNNIVMPRYLLLSYIYEITRILGVPLGVVVSLLVAYPTYSIAKSVSKSNQKKLILSNVALLTIVLGLSFTYSGLSLVLLWMIALLVTNQSVFLIGALFHPVGFILAVTLIIVKRLYIAKFVFMVFLFFLFLYISTQLGYFTSSKYYNIRYDINFDIEKLSLLFDTVISSKFNEIIVLVVIITISFLAKSNLAIIIKKAQKIYIKRFTVFFSYFIILCLINLYFVLSGKHTLLIDVIKFDISDPIYATWFDWGERDLTNDTPISLYNKRYSDSRFME